MNRRQWFKKAAVGAGIMAATPVLVESVISAVSTPQGVTYSLPEGFVFLGETILADQKALAAMSSMFNFEPQRALLTEMSKMWPEVELEKIRSNPTMKWKTINYPVV